MSDESTPILIYDGGCTFCTASATRAAAHWTKPARAVAAQSLAAEEIKRLGLSVDELAAAAWWVDASGRRYRGHLAIAQALIAAGSWRELLGRSIARPPLSWCAAAVYAIVARYRAKRVWRR